MELTTKISLGAWQNILLNGHDTFQSGSKMIDLDGLMAELEWEGGEIFWGSGLTPPPGCLRLIRYLGSITWQRLPVRFLAWRYKGRRE